MRPILGDGRRSTMNEEVMDWLTEEWTRKVAEKAHDKWTYLYHERKEPCIERQYVADFIARAAVRKVVELVESIQAARCPTAEQRDKTPLLQIYAQGVCDVCGEIRQSLKAAVEGE